MPKKLQITKLSFVILARSHNPSLLNPDFLKVNNIIDQDWITLSPTFSTEQLSQVIFKNGISLTLQPDRLTINQDFEDDFDNNDVLLADIASKYLKTLPHINYVALGINATVFVPFDNEEKVDDYITNTLLRPGDWKDYHDSTLEVSSNFIYSFDDYKINITLSKAIKIKDEKPDEETFGILFSGNIHRTIVLDMASANRIMPLVERVDHWQDDVNKYLSIINNCLLRDT
ncbi:hypothetical protein [Picosynechococcus sp. NKBG15041c]|uniref:hypothetical protein n=1 Tax=Picosynechococcus sp. NKBG15041c TaxID=1407650 RepID=UPI0004195219|nr:hypothetical protein [Picosynechococcus sp. NKBG15041c]